MIGKQAKLLSPSQIDELLLFVETTRHRVRNRVIVLLSVRAGLRAGEIAKLSWEMVLTPERGVADLIELRDPRWSNCVAARKHIVDL